MIGMQNGKSGNNVDSRIRQLAHKPPHETTNRSVDEDEAYAIYRKDATGCYGT